MKGFVRALRADDSFVVHASACSNRFTAPISRFYLAFQLISYASYGWPPIDFSPRGFHALYMDILVIDDSEEIEERLRDHLSFDHSRVTRASDLPEASDAIEKLRPQIVIVKDRLPSGSGLGLVQQVKNDLPESKVIMLTDMQDAKSKKLGMLVGVDYFCSKHNNESLLLQIVVDLVRRASES